ncbi:hypothetical protein COV05_04275 [Candidatus Uhrbacteria bacterium CG10_big_fil_rev_8_21_14_0_10_48_16]|uniref:Uncharacterized protein n=1 Tax=Candidatus Uhrbacteria bacterium CG10_big_fil_rev_8_21_14_0_10_48_16 TaxID=1975038 RepID=A0A2M8LGM6_9BACT|nr:MAG: hypothetical protein COV05_04275 [Candidatus Uhrbacteria bacterium CG10_big_fil_rev_8_21_14_0_10_48_16]
MHVWNLLTKGRYTPVQRYIALDWRKLFLDPQIAQITLAHEASHYVMGESEFGQAVRTIETLLDHMTHFSEEDRSRIRELLYKSQIFVQEGFATYMEIERLKSLRGKSAALQWAKEHLNRDHGYWDRFTEFSFAHDLSKKYRDFLVGKMSGISLETGMRRFGQHRDFLLSATKFEEFLSDPQNNPDERLRLLLQGVKKRPWLLTKSRKEIAEACGLHYNEPSTKNEVANYLTYLWSKTPTPHVIASEMIGDTPNGEQLFLNAFESLRITNLNLDFRDTSVPLYSNDDFIFYADVTEAVFYTEAGQRFITPALVHALGQSPDVALAAFPKGDKVKYITANSRENAVSLLNGPFRTCTQIVKHLGFDIVTNTPKLSPEVRQPNIVIYDIPRDMFAVVEAAMQQNAELRFKYRHIGASDDHPFQMLWIAVEGQEPFHVLTHYGNAGISSVISLIRDRATQLSDDEILAQRKHLNNLFVVGMDMPWEVDWTTSMIDGETIHYR